MGDGGWGTAHNPQSPIPNPQSPIPKKYKNNFTFIFIIKSKFKLYF